MQPELYSDSIFFIDVNKIHPNPYQPRIEFDEARLRDLADSIRQYGVLQPLVVTRVEREKEDGGIVVEYELIAGERRLRASRLAGLSQVPAVIRKEQDPMMKLELAIIENLQREDLNPVDRARAFLRLHTEFGFSHKDIGKKVGKSREYVSNSLRLLQMPQDILDALGQGKLTEGHTRPLLMLSDRPDEQAVLFKEIVYKKITVREAERIAREIAKERVRKKEYLPDPEIEDIQNRLQETLGTRVHIDRKNQGGKITIDFFSPEDLRTILDTIQSKNALGKNTLLENHVSRNEPKEDVFVKEVEPENSFVPDNIPPEEVKTEKVPVEDLGLSEEEIALLDDRSKDEMEKSEEDADLYNVSNFSL
ncbi:MAG: ParB family transcriptional regulator, chromosome partitioning protein [Patescibacteria group bacterium]|jgi:ParB family chromosome partitioning protein|nr:ParB family transcriptional regulator, chromosome partitioning protein [Patescibacteria group bacterium]